MSWETTGTVTVTNNSATVTGSGTLFTVKSRVGDAFIGPDGALYEIVNIVSNTVLSISPTYKGVTGSAKAYKIAPVRGYQKLSADRLYTIVNTIEDAIEVVTDFPAWLKAKQPTPVSAGGTGAETQLAARQNLGLKGAAVLDIGTAAGTVAAGDDARLTDAREWIADTIPQAEAEGGSATTRRAFTAQRVRQSIVAWFNGISGALGRTILTRKTAAQVRGDIGLGAVDNTSDTDKPISTAVTAALTNKVDKVAGKGLSDANYTQAEKNKLSSLESSKFVGLFVSESALPLSGSEGDYANVDGGVGSDVYHVIWDSSDGKWVKMQGVSTDLTPAQIKQQYESNPDTNAFTDVEKTKLSGIASDATKNRADSANADKVHTHTISDVTGLATRLDDIEAAASGGGGAGLTLFAESRSVASPNATVPVHALTTIGAEENIDFVIAPKGTGALSLQVPDGTSAGGNKRGKGAVDLQTSRISANQVASGANSFVSGRECQASGNESVAIGVFCVATKQGAIGMGNTATASGQVGSVALGRRVTSSGNGSAAIGSGCTASGDLSLAVGGNTTTRGVIGAIAEGVAQESASGRTQAERFLLCFDTDNASPVQLVTGQYTPGAPRTSNVPTMPDNSAYYCRVRVLARNTSTNESMSWSGTALIKRRANAASTTLIGSAIASDFGDAAMSACTVTLSADTTRGALAVIVTGLASTTIRWVAQLETVEAA